MFNIWFDIGFGLVIGVVALWLVFKVKKDSKLINDDDQIIKTIEKELRSDGVEHFELKSIVSLVYSDIIHVIVKTGHQEIAMEINNITGKILHKERLAR